MTENTCFECRRGSTWKREDRRAKLAELERLQRQAEALRSTIHALDELIVTNDATVDTHAEQCPEASRR